MLKYKDDIIKKVWELYGDEFTVKATKWDTYIEVQCKLISVTIKENSLVLWISYKHPTEQNILLSTGENSQVYNHFNKQLKVFGFDNLFIFSRWVT